MSACQKYIAEFIGTFALVFAGTGAIIINDVTGGAVTNVGVGLTFGMIVLTMIYAVGDVSGAHFNPAVTLGFFAARRLEGKMILPYVLSQSSGALVASLLLRGLFPQHPTLGTTAPTGPAVQSLILEIILTALLMFVILNVSRGCQGTRNHRWHRRGSRDCTGSAFCRPDFGCIDESGALLRPGVSLSTSRKSLDLSCRTGHGCVDCSRRMPVHSKRLLFCSPPWQNQSSMMKPKVLLICIHNSARSQMAEAFLNEICGDHFEAHSAGLEPGKLNPLAVETMREIGIDISKNQTQAVFNVFKSGELFPYLITVCDESSAERCPIFPGVTKRLYWSFPDPSALRGTREERLAGTREIRDQIRARIEMWCDEMCAVEAGTADSIPQPVN